MTFSHGTTYLVHTTNGHSLKGKATFVGPDRVWLTHEAGVHVIYYAGVSSASRIA